jgi:hypothetical protein
LYTEVSEYIERDRFAQEVDAFMHRGDRFTAQDGAALEARICVLERKAGIDCKREFLTNSQD